MKTIDSGKRIERLAYFSPTIAGFSFAVSYAPGGEKGGAGEANRPNTTPTNGISTVNNSCSLAVGYSGKFSDVSLDAYAGGSSGHRVLATPGVQTMTGRNNPSAIGGGAVVGFGPFKFGGAYERLYDVNTPVTNAASASSGHQIAQYVGHRTRIYRGAVLGQRRLDARYLREPRHQLEREQKST